MKGFVYSSLIMVLLVFGSANAKEIDISKLLIPDFVKAQVVSDGMNMNGMDVVIIQFYTLEPFKKIEQFYRKKIKEIKVSELAEWKIISWMDNKKLNTVQVAYNELEKAHHGFIALSNLPGIINKKVELGKGFPSIAKSTFQNDIKATDLNKISRTIWLINSASVVDNINFYKNYYLKSGWTVQQVSVDVGKSSGAMMLGKRGDEVNLTVSRAEGKSHVVAIVVEK